MQIPLIPQTQIFFSDDIKNKYPNRKYQKNTSQSTSDLLLLFAYDMDSQKNTSTDQQTSVDQQSLSDQTEQRSALFSLLAGVRDFAQEREEEAEKEEKRKENARKAEEERLKRMAEFKERA